MTHRESLEILAAHRGNRIVVATMGSVGLWPAISDTSLDFSYLPSSMGQGTPLGLGLSMASKRGVIVISGDGSLLMNLGCLITVANHSTSLAIVLIDNGLYEVTGGQDIAGAGRTDFAGIARSAGIPNVFDFGDQDSWRSGAANALAATGPSFIRLKVAGERGRSTPIAPRPMAEQIARLRHALATS